MIFIEVMYASHGKWKFFTKTFTDVEKAKRFILAINNDLKRPQFVSAVRCEYPSDTEYLNRFL